MRSLEEKLEVQIKVDSLARTIKVGMRPRDKRERYLPYKPTALVSSSVQVRTFPNQEPTKLFLRTTTPGTQMQIN